MNDLSIQGGRAYATAYASNEVKLQTSSQPTNVSAQSTTGSDTVSISAEAKELFQQSVEPTTEIEPSTGDTDNTTQSSGLGGRPDLLPPGTVSPSSSGLGGRPGG